MKTLDQIRKDLSPEDRKKVRARADAIIAEQLTLQQLRKAHHKTQTQVAKTLGMTQDQISRIEQRSDLLLSTLRKFVESMGGQLSLIAEFPAQRPIKLAGFMALEESTSEEDSVPPKRPRRSITRLAAKRRASRRRARPLKRLA